MRPYNENEQEEESDVLSPLQEEPDLHLKISSEHQQQQQPQEKQVVNQKGSEEIETIQGVLFGRSIRATYVVLDLAVIDDVDNNEEDEEEVYHVLVRIQFFGDHIKELRSHFRRHCKYGDLLKVQGFRWEDKVEIETEWKEPRLILNIQTIEEARKAVIIQQVRAWTMHKTQEWQNRYYRQQQQRKTRDSEDKQKQKKNGVSKQKQEKEGESSSAHSANKGLAKRQQGEYVANFLIHMIQYKLEQQRDMDDKVANNDASTWATTNTNHTPPDNNTSRLEAALNHLNSGSGVLDVAGGSGHVSMAMGLRGVKSTVVDPRENVGRLPGRDRKVWNRALKPKKKPQALLVDASEKGELEEHKFERSLPSNNIVQNVEFSTNNIQQLKEDPRQLLYCKPVDVRPFQAFRAWFGMPPQGVDQTFRNPDDAQVPVCDARHPLLQDCRAIVALHPDEASDAIVDTAVQLRIPFVMVPCCVFCRLFPHRRIKINASAGASKEESSQDIKNADSATKVVSTYTELLDYLQAKDPSIQRATLPFVGANTVLWSTFV